MNKNKETNDSFDVKNMIENKKSIDDSNYREFLKNFRIDIAEYFSQVEKKMREQMRKIWYLKIRLWKILFIFTMILIAFGSVVGGISTYSKDYTIERVSFTTQVSYDRAIANSDLLIDNVSILPNTLEVFTVHGYLIKPTNPVSEKLPAVVFQHGMVVNKEINLHNAIEIAEAGFLVLATDLSGHGSTGGLWDLGMNGLQSMWSAVEYLSTRDDVDHDRIAVAGHSNGGIIATRAGIFDKTPFGTGGKIKAVVAIFAISTFEETLKYFIGQDAVDDPDWGLLISSFGGEHDGDITYEDAHRRDISTFINSSNIQNYLLITGDKDQLTDPFQQYEVFSNATDGLYNESQLEDLRKQNPNGNLVVSNLDETGISFEKGNAREFILLHDQDHLAEMMRSENFQYIIHWLVSSLQLDPKTYQTRIDKGMQPATINILYNLRFVGWGSFIGSFFFSILMLGSLTSRKIFGRRPRRKPQFVPTDPNLAYNDELGLGTLEFKEIEKLSSKKKRIDPDEIPTKFKPDYIGDLRRFINSWKTKSMYMLFIIISFIAGISLAWIFQDYFLHYWILNQYILQFMYTSIFLAAAGIIMLIAYKVGDRRTKQVNLARIGLSWRGWIKSILFVLITLGIPIVGYNILAYIFCYPLFLPRPFTYRTYYEFGILLFILFLFYFSLEVISKTQLFEMPYEYPNWKGYLEEIFVNGTLIWGMWIISYLIGGLFMNEKLKWLIVQGNTGAFLLITANAIMIGIQGIMAYFSAFFYQRTKNLFSVALFETLLIGFLIAGKIAFIYS